MHVKTIAPGAYEFDVPVAALVKVSSRGLIGADRSALEKRASAVIVDALVKAAKNQPKNEPLVHLLAIGATEDYGPNRNGDGFKRATCEKYHETFVKHARFYRDHMNRDPRKAYGLVKLSAWHAPMRRIELGVSLNGDQEAADRNKGLIADKEMQKLAAGREIPVSMACRVPFDVCSHCGNKAPSRNEYCDAVSDGGHCKAGGLKKNLGAIVNIDGGLHHLHADNPDPLFFDISHVYKPADRIAYVSGLVEKQASAHSHLAVTAPYTVVAGDVLHDSLQVQRMLKLAYELADREDDVAAYAEPLRLACRPLQPVVVSRPALYREKLGSALRALVGQRIVLPLPQFLSLFVTDDREKVASVAAAVSPRLPGVYSRLLQDPNLSTRLRANPYMPAATTTADFQQWACKQAQELSLCEKFARARMTRAAIQQREAPALLASAGAADETPAARLAEEYAVYKLACLGAVPGEDSELQLTMSLALLQNYVR